MFNYETNKLISNVNKTIEHYQNDGYDIIYIAQMFPNLITNKWFIGFSIKGTKGAELYSKMNIVSNLYFEKYLPDTYSSKLFREHMKQHNYDEVVICGLDECGCVGATAKGALKTNVKVKVIKECTVSRFRADKIEKIRTTLTNMGVEYI